MGVLQEAYDAFISYSHADAGVARRIQRYLEHYRLPGRRSRLKIFLDTTDIRAAGLTAELEQALRLSRALVVCCSRAAAASEWVNREIDTFMGQNPDRPLVPLLVADDPFDGLPGRTRDASLRYADLRNGWLLGFMRPKARVELVRAIAVIAGLDLRSLIPWDRRLRRRRWTLALAAVMGLATATLFFPFEYTSRISVPAEGRALRTLEFCDVAEGRLILAAREKMEGPQGGRNYVALSEDGLSPGSRWNWLDDTDFVPRRRLLHVSVSPNALVRRAVDALDLQGLALRARATAREIADANTDEDGAEAVRLRKGFWIGEPVPGLFVAVFSIEPPKRAFYDEGSRPPPAAVALVGVGRDKESTRIAEIEGLYPPPISENPPVRRSAALFDGLAVTATSDGLWLGMPARKDGGVGGLWFSGDDGKTWQRQSISQNVSSLLADPQRFGRLLVSSGPGKWDAGVRSGKFEARLLERPGTGEDWRLFSGPPYNSDSNVQFCGVMPDGSLLTRVNRSLYRTGPYSLARLIAARFP